MLDESIRNEIFNPKRPIYTKITYQVPTRYGSQVSINNCLIVDGCTIEGQVNDSIISKGEVV